MDDVLTGYSPQEFKDSDCFGTHGLKKVNLGESTECSTPVTDKAHRSKTSRLDQ